MLYLIRCQVSVTKTLQAQIIKTRAIKKSDQESQFKNIMQDKDCTKSVHPLT